MTPNISDVSLKILIRIFVSFFSHFKRNNLIINSYWDWYDTIKDWQIRRLDRQISQFWDLVQVEVIVKMQRKNTKELFATSFTHQVPQDFLQSQVRLEQFDVLNELSFNFSSGNKAKKVSFTSFTDGLWQFSMFSP